MRIGRDRLGFFLAFLGAAACGGGGQAPTNDPDPLPQIEPVLMRQAVEDLLDEHTDPLAYTDLGTIPISGTAQYNGYFRGTLSNETDDLPDALIGTLTMSVQFGPNVDIDGSVTNIFDDSDQPVSGKLGLSMAQLDRTGNPNNDATLSVQADGTLTSDEGDQLELASRMEGDFLGTGFDAIGGAVFGRVTSGGTIQDFDGGFIAEK